MNNHELTDFQALLANGDVAGHAFHGNQYSDEAAGGDIKSIPGYRKSSEKDGVITHHVHVSATAPRAAAQKLVEKARARGDSRARVESHSDGKAEAVLHAGKTHRVNFIKGYDDGRR